MDSSASATPKARAFPSSTAPPRPCSSVYSDNFSLEDLVHKVDESMRVTQLNTIERLLRENSSLQEDLSQYRRAWRGLMDLLDEVFDSALLLQGSLEECRDKISAAEGNWLASWEVGGSLDMGTWI
jgi:hypothetical protein